MAKTATRRFRATTAAEKVLKSRSASASEKTVAASALTQLKRNKETTSKAVASKAAKILKDPKASREAKTVAASALTQRPKFNLRGVRIRAIDRAVAKYLEKQKA